MFAFYEASQYYGFWAYTALAAVALLRLLDANGKLSKVNQCDANGKYEEPYDSTKH
jgi:hypothetical protein